MKQEVLFNKTNETTNDINVLSVIQLFELCDSCGTKLDFKHQTNWMKCQVVESATCPLCQRHTPTRLYSLS